jgi:hypothetical protein
MHAPAYPTGLPYAQPEYDPLGATLNGHERLLAARIRKLYGRAVTGGDGAKPVCTFPGSICKILLLQRQVVKLNCRAQWGRDHTYVMISRPHQLDIQELCLH